MPIYEYDCTRCNERFELLIRSSSDKPKCPECGSSKVEKCFSVCASHTTSKARASGSAGHSHSSCSCGGCHSHKCSSCHK